MAAATLFACSVQAEQTFPADQITYFEKNVRPILAQNCYGCHGPDKQKAGLRLDSRDAVLKGTDEKKIVDLGNPDASVLIKAVQHASGAEAMPSKKPQLAATEVDALVQWVKMGLPWPKEVANNKPKWQDHWAFQPVKAPPVHKVESAKSKNPIDAFVAAKLEKAKLDFAPAADKATLARRMYLDMTGLQPSYEDVQAFVKDKSPDATKKLAEKLLNSPRYGERWARHWLDVARYSDTEGYTAGGKDNRYAQAYTYRDWVIHSLNADMPYDQFVMQQLAADRILEKDPKSAEHGQKANLAAMGFLTVNDSFLGDGNLQTDDRIDTVTRGLLGLTVACARCHDHKYDPIPAKDYYAMVSIFNSSVKPMEEPVIGQPTDKAAVAAYDQKVADVEAKKEAFRQEVLDDMRKRDRLSEYLLFAKTHADDPNAAFRGAAGKALLRDAIAGRWRDFVKQYALTAKPHPVMLAWKEFAALPEKEFAAKATEVAQRLGKPDSPANAVLRNELAKQPAPKNFGDVAKMYADVFLTCLSGTQPDNGDWKQIKALLTSPTSPMTVTTEGVERLFTRKDHEHMTKFNNELKQLEIDEPGAPYRAMVMEDRPKPADGRIMIRGNPARLGDPAPRAYLTMFGGKKFTEGSGRLELAQMIASKDNPLTARVIVNRVWMLHFGRPIVAQPSDFGVQSPKPEEAELLDYLAANFMENGWSLKKLHELILTSRTYQQSSLTTPEKDLKDPENNLLCRFNRQRLDYEQMRDSMLKVAGSLDLDKMGGHSVPLDNPQADSRRSVYLFVDRYEQPTIPATFDFANPDRHSPQRFVTTVPQQTLFLMNSPFVRKESDALGAKIPVEGSSVDSQAIKALYRGVLLRDPKPREVELAERFINDEERLMTADFLWTYGSAQVKKDPQSGAVSVTDFTEYKHLKVKGADSTWSPGPKVPDPKFGYCFWGAGSGHPSTGDLATTTQWTAPYDATINVRGALKRPADAGNGIHGWIISSRAGSLLDVHVNPKGAQEMALNKLQVKKGDVLTFAVTSENDTNSDGFNWIPVIERVNAGGKPDVITDARRDFCGSDHWPLNRARPQTPLSQLVQVLLMSNEFQFVD